MVILEAHDTWDCYTALLQQKPDYYVGKTGASPTHPQLTAQNLSPVWSSSQKSLCPCLQGKYRESLWRGESPKLWAVRPWMSYFP